MSDKQARRHARKNRSSRKSRARRAALTIAAAGTAATLAVAPIAPTPEASAVEIDLMDLINTACAIVSCNFNTAGLWTLPIMNFGSLLYSIPFLSEGEDPILPPGVIDLPGITIDFGIGTLQILGPTNINALIPPIVAKFSPTFFLADGASIAAGLLSQRATAGAHVTVGLMDGALQTGLAAKALQDSFDPTGIANVNAYVYALLRNPGRANGGFASRFVPDLVSGNVATKTGSFPTCPIGALCRYEPIKLDAGVGYDSFNDFPWSPWASISIINSVMQSVFYTNLMGDFETIQQTVGRNFYITIVPADSAILEPLRFPGRLLDLASIPVNPFFALANALEPAMDVLINVGYQDVNLTTYERSFMNYNTNFTFWEGAAALTPDQYFAAVGVAIGKAIEGLTAFVTSGFGLFGVNPVQAQPSTASSNATSQEELEALIADILTEAKRPVDGASKARPGDAPPAANALAADATDDAGDEGDVGDDQGSDDGQVGDDQGDDQGQVGDDEGDDQGQAGDDEGDDQGQAGDDHGQAGDDHGQAGDDHGQAGDDHGQAGDDHGQAGDDHGQAGDDHGQAGDDHGQAGDDHGQAGDDHGQAGDDHGQAGDGGTTGSSSDSAAA